MILHAEHEMNASTFAARVVAGTLADLHSAVVAAICALKGRSTAARTRRRWRSPRRSARPEAAADAVRKRFANKETVYGFGHPLYVTTRPARGDPQALGARPLSGCRRSELVRHHGRGGARRDRPEATVDERRSLLGPGLRATSAFPRICSRRCSSAAASRASPRTCSSSMRTTRSSVRVPSTSARSRGATRSRRRVEPRRGGRARPGARRSG